MSDESPFIRLGLPACFDLETASIERAFAIRSAAAHPDRGGDEAAFAHLATARDILLSPERRANALLDALGGPGPSVTTLPEGFLPEIMQTRLEIEEDVQSRGDAARQQWESWADEQAQEIEREIASLFTLAREEAKRDEALEGVRTQLNRWRYINRLREQLDPEASTFG